MLLVKLAGLPQLAQWWVARGSLVFFPIVVAGRAPSFSPGAPCHRVGEVAVSGEDGSAGLSRSLGGNYC